MQKCGMCLAPCQRSYVSDPVHYGIDKKMVLIPLVVPLQTCTECGFQFLGPEAEDLRANAVKDYILGLLRKEVKEIHKNLGCS